MKIDVLEKEKETLKIEVHDDLTLINLINENLWRQQDINSAAYAQEHPYLSNPVLLVKSKNPKKSLLDACEQIISDVTELKKEVSRL